MKYIFFIRTALRRLNPLRLKLSPTSSSAVILASILQLHAQTIHTYIFSHYHLKSRKHEICKTLLYTTLNFSSHSLWNILWLCLVFIRRDFFNRTTQCLPKSVPLVQNCRVCNKGDGDAFPPHAGDQRAANMWDLPLSRPRGTSILITCVTSGISIPRPITSC